MPTRHHGPAEHSTPLDEGERAPSGSRQSRSASPPSLRGLGGGNTLKAIVGAPVYFILALAAQGPADLASARGMLAAGDTARAIEVLQGLAAGARDEPEVTAALLLEWIGRSNRWAEAGARFRATEDDWRRHNRFDVSPAARVLALAYVTHRNREPSPVALTMLSAELDSAGAASLLGGGQSWVLAQHELASLDRRFSEAIPNRRRPGGCAASRIEVCVRQETSASLRRGARAPAPVSGLLRILQSDTALAGRESAATRYLERALDAPWPFSELAAMQLFALAVMFGDSVTQQRVAERLRHIELPAPLGDAYRGALAAFGGDLHGAHALMSAHVGWFAELDARIEALGNLPELDPAVIWRVGWPLYLEPVNERQIVHRARVLASGPIARTLPLVGWMLAVETDSSLLVRYGLPSGVGRHSSLGSSRGRMPIVASVDSRTVETLVRRTGALVPLDLGLAARDRSAVTGPSGYVDRHFDDLVPLEHQVARYVRDGRPLVEFYATRPDAQCTTDEGFALKAEQLAGRGPPSLMGFFLLDEQLGLVRRAVDSVPSGAPRRYVYRVRPEPGVYVYSVEHLDPACRQAARARYVLTVERPASTLVLSDIVLSATRRITGSQRVAGPPRPAALGRLWVDVTETVHLYWEVYGAPAAAVSSDRFEVSVEVLDLGKSRVSVSEIPDVARAVSGAERSLNMRYDAPALMGDGPLAMGLSIDLPPEAVGLHLVRVAVHDRQTDRRAAAQRALFVTGR